jgi:hypothetical protein
MIPETGRSPWFWGVAVFIVLALRHVDVLLNAQLTWEDSRIFLSEGISKPWHSTWFSPFMGYFIVMPKMVASMFTPLTMIYAPLVFNLFALAVMAFSITLPLSPAFSHLAPWRARALWVGASALMPWHTETFGNITNIHWYVFYALTLFSLANLTGSPVWVKLLLPFPIVLGVFTTPNAVAIVPVLLARLWLERTNRTYQFYLHLLTVGLIAIMVAAVLRFGTTRNATDPFDVLGLGVFLVKGLGYKVVIQNLAGGLGARVLQGTPLYLAGAAFFAFVFAALMRVGVRGGHHLRWPIIVAGYYVIASMLIAGIMRPEYVTHFVRMGNYWGADRYFVVPSFYLFLLLVVALGQLDLDPWSRRAKAGVLVLWAAVVLMNFLYPPIPEFHWRRQLRAYYQQLLAYPPGAPSATFSIVTFPGEPWSLQAPLFRPSESDREAIRRLMARLSE